MSRMEFCLTHHKLVASLKIISSSAWSMPKPEPLWKHLPIQLLRNFCGRKNSTQKVFLNVPNYQWLCKTSLIQVTKFISIFLLQEFCVSLRHGIDHHYQVSSMHQLIQLFLEELHSGICEILSWHCSDLSTKWIYQDVCSFQRSH